MKKVTTEIADAEPSFHIRGRFLSSQEFIRGLEHLAEALGFAPHPVLFCGDPGGIAGSPHHLGSLPGDRVLVASTRIPYNPRWGGYGGLPHLRRHGCEQPHRETLAGFLAPFLHCYHTLRQSIHIGCSPSGQPLVSLPTPLLRQGLPCGGHRLRLVASALVQGDGEEMSPPCPTSSPWQNFAAAERLRRRLATSGEELRPERHVPIGPHLDQEAIVFEAIDAASASRDGYAASLHPHLAEIVTDPTPNLRAAEYHLRHRFDGDTAYLAGLDHQGKILYVSVLEIDMTAMAGGEGHLLVPWQGYVAFADGVHRQVSTLTQDDLFLRLRRQDHGCPA